MPKTRKRNRQPIPGYRLIKCLGRGGFGEVWKCEAPGGLYKAIKFVEGERSLIHADAVPAVEELKAIQHIKSLRHPFLLSMERVELIDGDLVIVMELADKSLMDVFLEYRASGAAGIPRPELLRYLREAADVLDLMNLRHDLQHLDIKPGNLFLVCNHVKVADFGLVRSLADTRGENGEWHMEGKGNPPRATRAAGMTALYAAPEMFRNTISSSCDQYSLAIVYQELLTGVRPFNGKNLRQLLMQHCAAEPDLSALPESDRAAVARALSKEPVQRFPTCTAFVQALEAQEGREKATLSAPLATGHSPLGCGPVQARYLPDYQFHGCLVRTPFSETWEARTPEGQQRLVKVLFGITWREAACEQEAIECLQSLRHAALPQMRVLSGGPGCLIVETGSLRVSLRDRFQDFRGNGERGIPRRQLLTWLRPVATALDELARRYDLQHLGLHPRCLLFDKDELRIADFGLLPLVWRASGQLQGQLQARYAPPELFQQQAGPACDSYSLAVIFQEMLTGTTPWRGRRSGLPNLEALSPSDRAVMARALDIDPSQRFPTCTELLSALEGGRSPDSDPTLLAEGRAGASAIVAELIVEAKGALSATEVDRWSAVPAGAGVLQSRFPAHLSPQNARTGLETFRRQWNAQVVRAADHGMVFQVPFPGSFWKRWLGGARGLIVEVRWTRPRHARTTLPEVSVRIRCPDNKDKPDETLIHEVGPLLLDSLRSRLEAYPERRTQERVAWPYPVRATFLLAEDKLGETIEGKGKDLSLGGMGLYLPRAPAGSRLQLELRTPSRCQSIVLSGDCVRVQRCSDGWFEAGVLF